MYNIYGEYKIIEHLAPGALWDAGVVASKASDNLTKTVNTIADLVATMAKFRASLIGKATKSAEYIAIQKQILSLDLEIATKNFLKVEEEGILATARANVKLLAAQAEAAAKAVGTAADAQAAAAKAVGKAADAEAAAAKAASDAEELLKAGESATSATKADKAAKAAAAAKKGETAIETAKKTADEAKEAIEKVKKPELQDEFKNIEGDPNKGSWVTRNPKKAGAIALAAGTTVGLVAKAIYDLIKVENHTFIITSIKNNKDKTQIIITYQNGPTILVTDKVTFSNTDCIPTINDLQTDLISVNSSTELSIQGVELTTNGSKGTFKVKSDLGNRTLEAANDALKKALEELKKLQEIASGGIMDIFNSLLPFWPLAVCGLIILIIIWYVMMK